MCVCVSILVCTVHIVLMCTEHEQQLHAPCQRFWHCVFGENWRNCAHLCETFYGCNVQLLALAALLRGCWCHCCHDVQKSKSNRRFLIQCIFNVSWANFIGSCCSSKAKFCSQNKVKNWCDGKLAADGTVIILWLIRLFLMGKPCKTHDNTWLQSFLSR